ncbi:MAG: hypothetical protein HY054_12990 [Proteobacteria bacterium]|nr:hypothetical protein [Pseudomonadota bacterium]
MQRQGGPSPVGVVLASLSAACILLMVFSSMKSESNAPVIFGVLALILAFASARISKRANQGGQVVLAGLLITAFWTTALWVLWRTWRIAGGVYDHLFAPNVHHDSWRFAFQLISIPVLALVMQILLIALLTRLNDVSNRKRSRALEERNGDASSGAPQT